MSEQYVERWAVIPGFINYMVSDRGRILNVNSGRILKHHTGDRGSWCTLYTKTIPHTRSVGRLVAQAFVVGYDPKLEVDFIDGDNSNCDAMNIAITNNRLRGSNSESYRAKNPA